ncbi:MAG: hypothetical protein EOP05_00780 [Proteobacteria bacterium]|nr:MAG: hypothetical protein EOP05_00780 [Pseudomonadota bacterium]
MSIRFVEIKSRDLGTSNLLLNIEKTLMLQQWIEKAKLHLIDYHSAFEKADPNIDYGQNQLVRAAEAHYLASVTTYLRCYQDQPSYYLHINDVTANDELKTLHQELYKLRNDEFVHWKGIRSSVKALYSVEPIDAHTVAFAEKMRGSFQETIGPEANTGKTEELFSATLSYIESVRYSMQAKLRKRLERRDVFEATTFIDTFGQPVFRRNSG